VLKITTITEAGQPRIRLCGQLTSEYVSELDNTLKGLEQESGKVALDLSGVTFVDREAMVFLCGVHSRKIPIENVPSYVTRWIEQERRCRPVPPDSSKT